MNIQDITREDLKAIVHGLKMSTLSFVEDCAITEIESMVRSLPDSIEIDRLQGDALRKVQQDVGGIMRLVELYSKRDGEYKARYKSRTGLSPRYKVLEWVEVDKAANQLIRDLIKVSHCADEDGNVFLAKSFLAYAKTLRDADRDCRESLSRGGIVKEAQGIAGLKNWFGNKMRGTDFNQEESGYYDKAMYALKQLTKYRDQVGNMIQDVTQNIVPNFTIDEYMGGDLVGSFKNFYQGLSNLVDDFTHTAQQMKGEGTFKYDLTDDQVATLAKHYLQSPADRRQYMEQVYTQEYGKKSAGRIFEKAKELDRFSFFNPPKSKETPSASQMTPAAPSPEVAEESVLPEKEKAAPQPGFTTDNVGNWNTQTLERYRAGTKKEIEKLENVLRNPPDNMTNEQLGNYEMARDRKIKWLHRLEEELSKRSAPVASKTFNLYRYNQRKR